MMATISRLFKARSFQMAHSLQQREEQEELRRNLELSRDKANMLIAENDNLRRQNKDMAVEVEQLRSALARSTVDNQKLEDTGKALQNQIQEQESYIDALRSEIDMLQVHCIDNVDVISNLEQLLDNCLSNNNSEDKNTIETQAEVSPQLDSTSAHGSAPVEKPRLKMPVKYETLRSKYSLKPKSELPIRGDKEEADE